MTNETVLRSRQILHLWDTRVNEPSDKYPLSDADKLQFARSIEQAVLQSPEVQARQWQPIETAPKDFVTEFDGWNGERVPNVIWAHPEYEAKGEYAWCRSFYEHNHGWTMERVRGLTHWMPLPAPPLDAAMEKQL